MHRAQDVMAEHVVTLKPEATVEEAMHALLKYGISGVPVVNAVGCLCGIISEFQLIEVLYDPGLKNAKVSGLMARDVLTVSEETLLTEVADLFILHRIRRLPVVRGEQLVGLICRRDLLRYAIEIGEAAPKVAQDAAALVRH